MDKNVQNLLKLATSRSCSTSRNFFQLEYRIIHSSPNWKWNYENVQNHQRILSLTSKSKDIQLIFIDLLNQFNYLIYFNHIVKLFELN